jgi:copper transport protein
MRRTIRRVLGLLGVFGGCLLAGAVLGVIGATPASAHAVLISTEPVNGARLDAAPATVTATFSESVGVQAGYFKVVSSKGNEVQDGAPEHPGGDGTKLSVRLRPNLPDDSYIASYRVVSADSHPVGGAFAFVVGNGPLVGASGAVLSGGTTNRAVSVAFTTTRWLTFAGVALLGGLAFVVLCWPAGRGNRRARQIIWTGWAAVAAGTLLALLLEGPYAAGSGLSDAVNRDLLQATLGTTFGRMLSARLMLLGVLAVYVVRMLRDESLLPERARARDEDITAIVGLGVLATIGGTGHAAAGSQSTLALLSDTTHLTAMALWVGGLVLLATCLLPSRAADELAGALPRFSQIAFGSVLVLAGTGTYQAWREIGPLPALWTTGYGQLLLAKISVFLLLVGIGNLSRLAVGRRYLMPAAQALSASDVVAIGQSEQDRLVRRLGRSVAMEVGIAAVVLALTAVLVGQPPARASYTNPYSSTLELASGGSVRMRVTPARPGANTVRLDVFDRGGKLASPQQVTMTAELPAARIGPLAVSLTKTSTGRYQSTDASFPQAGTWQLVVRVQTSEFERSVAQADVPVR